MTVNKQGIHSDCVFLALKIVGYLDQLNNTPY